MGQQRPSQRRVYGPSKRICRQRSHCPKQALTLSHFPDLHSPQSLRQPTADFRSQIREQSHQTTFDPLHGPSALKTDSPSRRMDGMSRHSGCIPSYQNAPINAQVPLLPNQRATVRVHLSSVRPEHRPPCVHFRSAPYHLPTAHRTHKCPELPGRSDCLGHLSSSMLQGHSPDGIHPPGLRISDPPHKVTTSPKPAEGMARLPVGLGDRLSNANTAQCTEDTPTMLPHPQQKTFLQNGNGEPLRPVSVCCAASSHNSLLQAVANSPPQGLLQGQFTEGIESGAKQTPPKVGKHRRLERERTSPPPTSRHNHLDRRVENRLGPSRHPRKHLERRMEHSTSTSPHQRSRAKNSRDCSGQSSRQNRPMCSSLHRQCSDLLHLLKTRLNQESPDASSVRGVTRHHHTKEPDADSQTYSGNPQCPGRRPFTLRTHCNRMGTGSTRLLEDPTMGRPSGGRLDGDALQLQTDNIHLSVPTPTSGSSGCSFHPMGQMAKGLSVSSGAHARSAPTSDTELPGNANPHPGPAFSISPPDSTNVLGEGFTSSPPSPQPEGRRQDPHCILVTICSMDRSAFLLHTFNNRFGKDVAESLVRGFRESTRRQQEYAWRALQEWIRSRPITTLSLPLLLQFIRDLRFQKNFASQTIAAYKSALALPLKEAFGLDLSDPHFTLLLKSLFLERPPKRSPELRWNLTKVLQFLRQPRFKPSAASEGDLLHKCLLLTALATGNRGAELAAFSREGISYRQDGSVVISVRPGFLYKNQSADRTPPPIVIRPLTRNPLCPVANLTKYLATSSTTQGHLFIHPLTRRPLNRGQIAFRVCRLIKEADPSGIPQMHDLRRAAVSIAWTRGVSPAQIIQSAFWSNSNVFIKRYLKRCSAPKCVALGTLP